MLDATEVVLFMLMRFFEADVGDVASAATQSNGKHLCRPILRAMEKLLENRKIICQQKINAPRVQGAVSS